MTQVWNDRAQGNDAETGCSRWEAPRLAEITGARGLGLFVVVRGDTSAAFAVMPGGVHGDARGHWAYVLRASLKVQSSFDIWNFEGFMPLAQRQLGR